MIIILTLLLLRGDRKEPAPFATQSLNRSPGHAATRDVPDQVNAMLRRFIEHAAAIAAEMIRTAECSSTPSHPGGAR